jgi:hypothetical protein
MFSDTPCTDLAVAMQVPFDPNHWMDKATAVTVGCAFAAAVLVLWPCVKQIDATRRSSMSGLTAGVILALLGSGVQLLACGGRTLCVL